MSFTEKIAKFVLENDYDLKHLVIVLPSQRAIKYLERDLAKVYQKPILAPKLVTIDRLIKEINPLPVIDKTSLLLELYNVHSELLKEKADSFDEFLTWGTTILSDFDELDRYLINSHQLFRNLTEIKELESWNVEKELRTPAQIKFLEFWENLHDYYLVLNKNLATKKVVYAGKAYRNAAENLDLFFEEDKDAQYLFAGYNALSKAELSIIKQLIKMGRGNILIDADSFYFNTKHHEAGRFLRGLEKELDYSPKNFIQDKLRNDAMNVKIIECPQPTGQVKVAATELSKLNPNDMSDTLLLMADESLINSMVRTIPANVIKANITLGLPIRNTSINTWVDLLFSIQNNKAQFQSNHIYFKDVLAFINHPFIYSSLNNDEKRKLQELEDKIRRNNWILINPDQVLAGEKCDEILKILITDWNNDWELAMKMIRDLNSLVYKSLSEDSAFEKAILECFDKAILEFHNIVTRGMPTMQLKTFKELFGKHWKTQSIAYHGNPTDGLQIMGLLETRCLNFKRVIAIGMNEGNLPPTNPINTVIPMDLRRFFEMPLPRDKQGLFAHHFYRLLHDCEELILTYTSASDLFGSSEKSRYLTQILLELSKINENIKPIETTLVIENKKTNSITSFEKNETVLNKIENRLSISTSASMLKKYLTCPLDFYYRYVLDFGESQEVEDEIEANTFGTFIHETLEDLYEPFARINKEGREKTNHSNITSFDVEKMIKNFPLVLEQKFLEHFNQKKTAFKYGKNRLSYEMAKELIERFLNSEKKFLEEVNDKVFIEALEMKIEEDIPVTINGKSFTVKLNGTIDRVDRIGDEYRIIDYKTGKVEFNDVKTKKDDIDAESLIGSYKTKKHLLQLIMYLKLFYAKTGKLAQPAIISFISNKNEPMKLSSNSLSLSELNDLFPETIEGIVSEMMDTSIDFEHNDKQYFSYCNYCE